MKWIFGISLFFLLANNINAQLISGDLLDNNRKIISNNKDTINSSSYDDKILFKIAVNNDGLVTSATVIEQQSTIVSTPATIMAKKNVLKVLFEEGSYFPKYHTGIYQIVYKKTN